MNVVKRTIKDLNDAVVNSTTTESDPITLSEKLWNEDFSHRPSWCDASLALLQIKDGKAKGNKPALYLRCLLQNFLFKQGCFIQRNSFPVIFVGLVILSLFAIGLRDARIETDLDKLWVQKEGRLYDEQQYLAMAAKVQAEHRSKQPNFHGAHHAKRDTDKKAEADQDNSGPTGGSEQFLVLIQTSRHSHKLIDKQDFLVHEETLSEVAKMKVNLFNETWSLKDICFRPTAPPIPENIKAIIGNILEELLPCVIITPLDCFWEGSKPLGPFPPVVPLDILVGFDVFPEKVTWKNLDPQHALNEVLGIGIEIPVFYTIKSLYDRAGISSGYQTRSCIEPLDPECPKRASNYVDLCPIVEKILEYNEKHNNTLNLIIKSTEDTNATTTESPFDAPLSTDVCAVYGDRVRRLLLDDPALYDAFVPRQAAVDLAGRLNDGCRGFAENYMRWPDDLIVGGVKRQQDRILSVEALESVFMLASAVDIHARLHAAVEKPHLNESWTVQTADKVLMEWQRSFTSAIYGHRRNSETHRLLHPLSGTSINDMLEQFSRFNPTVIIIGYVFMIFYASLSLCSFADRGIKSGIGLGMAGCLLVTLAGVAGLGCSMLLGIPFNAATTQIVPFLTLGLGVDDMFLLVHSYRDIVKFANQNEIGFLLKETGLSAFLTSINNILAFLAGGLMPVPALRDFCLQVAILLTFNAISILTIYPAIMCLDLRRRKSRRPDILCCMKVTAADAAKKVAKASVDIIKSKQIGRPVSIVSAVNGHEMTTNVAAPQDTTVVTADGSGPVVSFTKTHLRSCSASTTATNRDIVDPTLAGSEINLTDSQSHSYLSGVDSYYANGSTTVNDTKSNGFFKKRCSLSHWTLHRFVSDYYNNWLSKIPVKIFVLCLNAIVLAFGVFNCANVILGLELTDVIPKGTAANAFLEARETYFSFYAFNAILKGPVDLSSKQTLLRDFRRDVSQSKYVVKRKGELQEQFWLDLMRDWLKSLQDRFDDGLKSGKIKVDNETGNITLIKVNDEAVLTYKLMCSFGERVDRSRASKIRLVDEKGLINNDGFLNYLTAWVNLDPMTYHVSQAAMSPKPSPWSFNNSVSEDDDIFVPPADNIVLSRIPFFLYGLIDTPSIVDMIEEVRAVCDKYDSLGLPIFPEGIPFKFWEQYLHLRWNLVVALLIVIGSVFVIISLLLVNPWTSSVVTFVLVLLVVELAGFMGAVGLKLNAVSAVSLITAVGIGVEFTVHVSLSFLTALGTRDQRMARTLEHMFIPVLHGGLSTLLGVIMLAFSEFEFIVRYFFMVMSALIVLGLLNGLVLLPVLLSIVGPPSEVRTVDGSHYLPLPSPNAARRNNKQKQVVETF